MFSCFVKEDFIPTFQTEQFCYVVIYSVIYCVVFDGQNTRRTNFHFLNLLLEQNCGFVQCCLLNTLYLQKTGSDF